jgi:hypothetical protein
MRGIRIGLLVALLASGCEPEGQRRAASENVVADAPNRGALWPIMLQHCLRNPNCDPTSDFGQGAGQASGLDGAAAYFVETKDVVKEGGKDYGAALTVSVYGARAQGGKAGRPLTIDEAPDNLRGAKARRSTLGIEYRTPGGGKPEAYGLAVFPAWVAMKAPGAETAKTQEEIAVKTGDYTASASFGRDKAGMKVEISSSAGVLATFYSIGIAAGDKIADADAVKRGFEPWVFYASQNIRDEPLPALMKALAENDTLTLKVSAPDGGTLLYDAIYAAGYTDALKEAALALADPAIAAPIPTRCKPVEGKPQEFWVSADVTAALRTCDPRSAQRRQQDSLIPAGKPN